MRKVSSENFGNSGRKYIFQKLCFTPVEDLLFLLLKILIITIPDFLINPESSVE